MAHSRAVNTRSVRRFALACVLMSTAGSSAGAQGAPTTWQWSITPYAWLARTEGRVGAGNISTDVDLSAGDLLKSVDVVLMAVVQAQRGRWLGHVDLFYVSASDDANVQLLPGIAATLKVQQYQTMVAPEVGYTLYTRPNVAVDAVAGLRYWHVKAELTAALPARSVGGSNSADWVDGIVGATVRAMPWGPRWHLLAYGDLGAGGANFTWQALGGATYDFSHCCSVGLTYRHLDVDYESDKLINDVSMTGPAISLGFRF